MSVLGRMRAPDSWRGLPYGRRAQLLYGGRPRSRGEAAAAREYVAHMRAPVARAQQVVGGLAAFLTAFVVGQWTQGVRAGVTVAASVLVGWIVVIGLVNLAALPSLQRRAAGDGQ